MFGLRKLTPEEDTLLKVINITIEAYKTAVDLPEEDTNLSAEFQTADANSTVNNRG